MGARACLSSGHCAVLWSTRGASLTLSTQHLNTFIFLLVLTHLFACAGGSLGRHAAGRRHQVWQHGTHRGAAAGARASHLGLSDTRPKGLCRGLCRWINYSYPLSLSPLCVPCATCNELFLARLSSGRSRTEPTPLAALPAARVSPVRGHPFCCSVFLMPHAGSCVVCRCA